MKKILSLTFIFVAIVVVGLWLIDPFNLTDGGYQSWMSSPQPPVVVSPQPSPSPQPTTEASADAEVPSEIATGWTWIHDPSLQVRAAYPADWFVQAATSAMDELAVTSFDPASSPNTEGILVEELKIAVNYFGPLDSRDSSIDQARVMAEKAVTVDGRQATQYQLSGQSGESLITRVETDEGVYLITALPGDSELLDQYQRFLQYLQLVEPAPVTLNQPRSGSVIELPLVASGSALGNWFNEGQLSVSLETSAGDVITSAVATTDEDWMSIEPVNFSAELTGVQDLSQLDSIYGLLVFEKSNPSGLPENANQVVFPLRFKEQE